MLITGLGRVLNGEDGAQRRKRNQQTAAQSFRAINSRSHTGFCSDPEPFVSRRELSFLFELLGLKSGFIFTWTCLQFGAAEVPVYCNQVSLCGLLNERESIFLHKRSERRLEKEKRLEGREVESDELTETLTWKQTHRPLQLLLFLWPNPCVQYSDCSG